MPSTEHLFTPGKTADLVPKGDTARQAVDSLRGYAYQVLASALAWVDIDPRDQLYLEVAEDYAVVAEDVLKAVQVKDTYASGNVTLNNENVREAIASYIDIAARNPSIAVSLHFLTTSNIGTEKLIDERPGGIAGLDYWRKAAAGADVSPLRRLLESVRFPEHVREFCRTRDDVALRRDLLQRIKWDCGQPDLAILRSDLEERLIVLGRDRFMLPAREARNLADVLAFHVLRKSILKEPEHRVLKRSELYDLVGQAAEIVLPRTALPEFASALASGLASTVVPADGGSTRLASGDPDWLISSRTLPQPKRFIARDAVQTAAALAVSSHGCAILTGATGLGKSHIARAAALQRAGEFLLVDFRDLDAAGARRRLDNVFGRVGGLDSTLLIFEDLNHLRDPSVSRALGRVMEALRYRDRTALVTCYNAPSARSAADASLDVRGIVPCPYFSENESRALVALYGGDPDLWGKLAHVVGAFGHPQLTHAFVVGMAARGWPRSEIREVVGSGLTSGDVAAERESARTNLIAALPENSKALLFRLSFLIGRFDRQTALAVGKMLTPISQTGDALDVMVGPWIESIGRDQYRISPLASNSGRTMLAPDDQEALHASIALHIVMKRTIEASDIDAILMHAMLGKSPWALTKVSIGILTVPQDKLRHIAENITLFKVLDMGDSFYLGEPAIASIVRLAQFKVLDAAGEEEQAAAAAAAARRAVSQIDAGELQTLTEVMVLTSVLATMNVADYLDGWVAWLQRFRAVIQSELLREDIRTGLQMAALESGVDPLAVFFNIGAGRLTSVGRLENIVDALAELNSADRNVWLAPVGEAFSDYSIFIHGPWAAQQNNPDFDAADAVKRYARIADKTKDWGLSVLTMQAWIARAVVLDENMSQGDAALMVLDDAVKKFGDEPRLLRARAKIYWRRNDHPRTLEILRSIADVVGSGSTVERAFALREAAISAAKCGDWKQAEIWLREASAAAAASQTDEMHVMAVGLDADAAVAAVMSGDWAHALRDFAIALTGLATIDPESGLRAAYCHRVIRHAVLWTQSLADETDMLIDGKPIGMLPGTCSNPDPPEAVRSLPLAPLDIAWYMLAEVEAAIGINAGVESALGDKLVGGRIPVMEMAVRGRHIRRAIEMHDKSSFAASLVPYVDVTAYLTGQQRELREIFDVMSPRRGEIPLADRSTELVEHIAADAILAFGICAAYAGRPSGLAELHAELSKRMGADHIGHGLFGEIAGQREGDLFSLVKGILDELDSSTDHRPARFWLFGLRFYEHHDRSGFGRLLFPKLAGWLRDGWERILCNQAFLLFQPLRTTTAIREAITNGGGDKAVAASILLASVDATRVRIGEEYQTILRAAAGQSTPVGP